MKKEYAIAMLALAASCAARLAAETEYQHPVAVIPYAWEKPTVDGKVDDAIRCHRRALELFPDFVDALVNLGNALAKQERHEEAMASYQRAFALQPQNALILNNMGALLENRGRMDEAVACYRRALELDPRIAATYSNLGSALKKTGLKELLEADQERTQSFAGFGWITSISLNAT